MPTASEKKKKNRRGPFGRVRTDIITTDIMEERRPHVERARNQHAPVIFKLCSGLNHIVLCAINSATTASVDVLPSVSRKTRVRKINE